MKQQLGDDWADKITSMFSEGASEEEIYSSFGLSKAAWAKLIATSPGMAAIVELGKAKQKAHWLMIGRKFVTKPPGQFNTVLWKTWMRHMYGWDENSSKEEDLTASHDQMSEKEIDEEIKKLTGG